MNFAWKRVKTALELMLMVDTNELDSRDRVLFHSALKEIKAAKKVMESTPLEKDDSAAYEIGEGFAFITEFIDKYTDWELPPAEETEDLDTHLQFFRYLAEVFSCPAKKKALDYMVNMDKNPHEEFLFAFSEDDHIGAVGDCTYGFAVTLANGTLKNVIERLGSDSDD